MNPHFVKNLCLHDCLWSYHLRGPGGSFLAGEDSPRIPRSGYLTLPASGPYLIGVTSYSANVTGNYTLRLSGSNCSYTLSSTSQSVAAGGGAGAVGVNTSSNCAWKASASASWVTINSGASGKGPGAVIFTVAANTGGSARSAVIQIADKSFTISQLGDGSSCALTPISQGQTLAGSLTTSDCRSPVRGSSYYADRYSFTGAAGQAVAVSANTSFTGSLYLMGVAPFSRRSPVILRVSDVSLSFSVRAAKLVSAHCRQRHDWRDGADLPAGGETPSAHRNHRWQAMNAISEQLQRPSGSTVLQ